MRRVVLITGAAGGIGSAVARAFANAGAALSLADTSGSALADLADELRSDTSPVHTSSVDVRRKEQVQGWIRATLAEFGRVDVLVNVAGVRANGSAAGIKEDQWDFVVDTNLKGTFLCCQAAMEAMKKQTSGRIINIGSILAKNSGNARPWLDLNELNTSSNVAYGAAKAGVHVLTLYLAKELAAHRITVNAVAPGPVSSPMTANSPASRRDQIPLRRYASPEDVAHAVLFLASEESAYITGEILDVNGGMWCD